MASIFWFRVSFDDMNIYIDIDSQEEGESSRDIINWDDIIRVCYRLWSYLMTDELYIFTNQREESYLIPMECIGGSELWGEIIERELYDAELAIKIMSEDIGIYCWPEITE